MLSVIIFATVLTVVFIAGMRASYWKGYDDGVFDSKDCLMFLEELSEEGKKRKMKKEIEDGRREG